MIEIYSKNTRVKIILDSKTYNLPKSYISVIHEDTGVGDYFVTVNTDQIYIEFLFSELSITEIDTIDKLVNYLTLDDLERKITPLIDENMNGYTYLGYSDFLSTLTADPKWYIIRIDADGIQDFSGLPYTYDQIWDDRTTITYER